MNQDRNQVSCLLSRTGPALALLLALAAIPRILSWLAFDFIDSGGGSDPVAYLNLACNLFSGNGFSTFGEVHTIHHPLYPVFIGIFWKILGDLLLAGQLVSVLAGIALIIPVYSLARNLFGPRAAFYAGLFTAFCPILVYGSSEAFCESLYVFLLISAVAVLANAWRKGRILPLAGAGLLVGGAFLTHPAGITFLPIFLLFLLAAQWLPGHLTWRVLFYRVALILVGFCLAGLPWWIYLRIETGRWQVSGSSHYQDISLMLDEIEEKAESQVIFEHMELIYQGATESEYEREEIGIFALFIQQPEELVRLISHNLSKGAAELAKSAVFLGISYRTLILILGATALSIVAGIIFLLLSTRRFAEVLLLTLLFLPALTFVLLIVQHRYFYPFFPLAWILIGAVLAAGVERCQRVKAPRFGQFIRLLGVVIAVVLLAGSAGVIRRKWKKEAIPYEYKMLGEWMRENLPGLEEEKVMAFRLGFSFYAGSSWNVFYWGDYPGLLAYLQERGISYLIIDDYKLYMINPALRFLIEDPPPEEFEEIKTKVFQGRRARLLRLREDG